MLPGMRVRTPSLAVAFCPELADETYAGSREGFFIGQDPSLRGKCRVSAPTLTQCCHLRFDTGDLV